MDFLSDLLPDPWGSIADAGSATLQRYWDASAAKSGGRVAILTTVGKDEAADAAVRLDAAGIHPAVSRTPKTARLFVDARGRRFVNVRPYVVLVLDAQAHRAKNVLLAQA